MSDKATILSRRKLLTRLGATAAAIYVAPALTETTGEAEAGGHYRKSSYGRRRGKYSYHSKYKRKRGSRRRYSSRRCKPTPPPPPPDTIPE